MVSKRQPDLLLGSVTRKGWEMLFSHQVSDSDRGRSTSSYVRNCAGDVKNGDIFMDRSRHLHLRQLGGNLNSGKNCNKIDGKISNGGKSGKYSRFEPLNLAHSFFFFFFEDFVYMSCTRRGVNTEHLTVRTTDAHFYRRVSHFTKDLIGSR